MVPFPPGWINTNPSTGINNAGFVAGVGTVGPSGATGQAYIGSVSFSRPIPFAPGWTFSFGRAVNNLGQVTGDDLKGHIFIGTISGSSALPLPAGFNSAGTRSAVGKVNWTKIGDTAAAKANRHRGRTHAN